MYLFFFKLYGLTMLAWMIIKLVLSKVIPYHAKPGMFLGTVRGHIKFLFLFL